MALQRILADPEFVFRKETEPPTVKDGQKYRISDLELASRLSFFLWSSIPDDELITVASQNKLHEPAVLEKEVRRMLADPKSDRAGRSISPAQWLNVRSSADHRAARRHSTPISTTISARPCARRWSCSSAASSTKIAA